MIQVRRNCLYSIILTGKKLYEPFLYKKYGPGLLKSGLDKYPERFNGIVS